MIPSAFRPQPLRLFRARDVPPLRPPGPAAPVLEALLAPGGLDEDAAHGLGGGGEEVAPILPGPSFAIVDQPGRLRVRGSQPGEGVVEGDEVVTRLGRGGGGGVQFDAVAGWSVTISPTCN